MFDCPFFFFLFQLYRDFSSLSPHDIKDNNTKVWEQQEEIFSGFILLEILSWIFFAIFFLYSFSFKVAHEWFILCTLKAALSFMYEVFYVLQKGNKSCTTHYYEGELSFKKYYWLWDVPRQHNSARYILFIEKYICLFTFTEFWKTWKKVNFRFKIKKKGRHWKGYKL